MLNWIKSEPVAIAFAINAGIQCAIEFGLNVTSTQLVAINVLVAALLTIIVRSNVTPVEPIQFKVVNAEPPTELTIVSESEDSTSCAQE